MKENEIEVRTQIAAPIEKVWEYYTSPEHITKWAFASDDWEAPHAENDLRVGGRFVTRMQSKDPSHSVNSGQASSGQVEGFDFCGTYDEVVEHELIKYTMDGQDARKVTVTFAQKGEVVEVITTFEMEHENSRELQQAGWQAILDNFKKHVETE